MPTVRGIISALRELVHAPLPAAGRAEHGEAAAARRARPAAWVRPPARLRTDPAELVKGPYAHPGAEPLLEEVLHDPIVHSVMRADHLEPADVRRVVVAARQRLVPTAAAEPLRRRAYELWEQEGRPEGCADTHWFRAEAELRAAARALRAAARAPRPAA